jgi:hypothetical protein
MSHNHTIPTRLAESPVPGNRHAGFGGRVEETGRPKGQYRASARPYNYTVPCGLKRKARRAAKSKTN